VEWAAASGGTGLYASSDWGRRDFDYLDQFGSWGSTESHGDSVSITDSSHPHWTGTYGTVTNINSWGNTHHAYIDSYPSDFSVTATRSSGGDLVVVREGCDVDGDGYDRSTGSCGGSDCDDGDDTVYPGAAELCDGQINDCGTSSLPSDESDIDGDGYVECAVDSGGWDGSAVTGYEDCDDDDATVYPGATELCDGQLNDCNGSIGSGEVDNDGDTYVVCTLDSGGWDGSGTVTDGDDCDDNDATVYPTAPELCDGQDNDCTDGVPADETDDDGDGWVECTLDSGGWDGSAINGGEDCDDADADTWPGADEYCDGHDDDCDLDIDEDDSVDAPTWYADVDGDTYGNAAVTNVTCYEVFGWVLDDTDCDDTDAASYPGATEVAYDGVDQDCDGADLCDVDSDGFDYDGAECFGEDCDDADADVNPDAVESWYDGVDQDCAGDSDYDADGDGFDSASFGGEDCDDANPDTYPGAPDEPGDGIINDCDGADEYDADGDGFDGAEYGGSDCDDSNSTVNPGADEIWYDGVDQDCDGNDDDQDGDGWSIDDDCDDTDPQRFENCSNDSGDDTGVGGDPKGGGGCGCSSANRLSGVGGLLGLLALLVLRRRR